MAALLRIAVCLTEGAFRWAVLLLRSIESVQAENLVQPRRMDVATRVSLADGDCWGA